MEVWEKEHIREILHELIDTTNCNVTLTCRLRSCGVLSRGDMDVLDTIRNNAGEMKQVEKLYDLLGMKKNGFSLMAKALFESEQVAPAEKLVQVYQKLGKEPPDVHKALPAYKDFEKKLKE